MVSVDLYEAEARAAREELAAVREVLSSALEVLHEFHVERVRMTRQIDALFDERRAWTSQEITARDIFGPRGQQ